MKTIEIKKIQKWWYVIVKNEAGENIAMANFTTKKAATAARDSWVKENDYKVLG